MGSKCTQPLLPLCGRPLCLLCCTHSVWSSAVLALLHSVTVAPERPPSGRSPSAQVFVGGIPKAGNVTDEQLLEFASAGGEVRIVSPRHPCPLPAALHVPKPGTLAYTQREYGRASGPMLPAA